ncbi:AraC family transcriptional regulator [Mycobacterium sp. PS03-16]|nr:AraC family transcriptional regulator [Mycobacterium sp. PS03-16]
MASVEELVRLLRPEAVLSKVISGGGQWSVRKPRYGEPAFCLMLSGSCLWEADGVAPIELNQGDFLLLPETPEFTLASDRDIPPVPRALDYARETRHGSTADPATMRMLGGYFRFDGANAPLLVPLLPRFVLVRDGEPGASRLGRVVELIADEADADRPCRDAILERLVEVLVVEAIRLHAAPTGTTQRGLLAGLSDPVLAPALRQLHADIAHGWTVERLARAAGVSRAVFAERFTRTIGVPPMQYLVHWRVAVAKDILRTGERSVAEVARRVGYQSASAFTSAFTRLSGCTPTDFARSPR